MTVTPGLYNILIYQGTDVVKTFSGFPLDLSTCQAIQIDIRSSPGRSLILGFSLTNGLAFSGPGNTTLTWTLINAQTLMLPTNYQPSYDLRITDAAGLEEVYIKGTITTTPRVTTGAPT